MSTSVQVGRNDACPCGSGKKYKRCCISAVQARMMPPRPAQRNGERLVFHQTPEQMAAAREQAAIPPPQPQFARPAGPSPSGGETIKATGGHPFWVISGEDLDKRPVPEHCPAEVPNAALPGRWVNAIDLRLGDILFTRDGRRVPVTHVSVQHTQMKVYNLQVAELENYAVGYSGILVHNSSAAPQSQWQWTPSRATPQPPRPGGTAPSGDIPELIQHVRQVRRQGATIAEAEQAWVDGMRLINQRAAQFPGNGPVVNDFFGVVGREWRVYVGRPAVPGGDTFAFAFNSSTGVVAQGLRSGIRPHPGQAGELALFNFTIIHP